MNKNNMHTKVLTDTLDGCEAVARVAYKTNEVCIIFPITPASSLGEYTDQWAAKGQKNIWGIVPDVVEMQSEAGAAGAVHGALQTGALATTFTASQGLLLMIPNMYKIAGELTPTVFHVAARSLAVQALSIFGDQSDVMAARSTGFAMLCSPSVQAAQDFALISQKTTLECRVPFIHFFDGFRTSHEINRISLLSDEQIRAMLDGHLIHAHRQRALNPENPFIRGTAQNPDVYFQSRETVNPFYDATPEVLQKAMDRFAEITGRQYHLIEYHGHPEAERVIVIMGSGTAAVSQTIDYLGNNGGGKLGVITIQLYRPFPVKEFLAAFPKTTQAVAVLDRTKEPGADGEPLYKDIIAVLAQAQIRGELDRLPKIIGGRYGLSSKEFTPAMVKGIFDELKVDKPKNLFTIGINDDLSFTSLDYDSEFIIEDPLVTRAVFYGLGSDGTVGANKNSIKIIGTQTSNHAQGFFVYDSKKAGSQTISHLRFGPKPIDTPYLVQSANFIGCHQFDFLSKVDVLGSAAEGSTFLLNSPYSQDEVWDRLPRELQEVIINRNIEFWVIDAYAVARETGMGVRINTIMQTCFFAIANILPKEEAIDKIKQAIHKTFIRKGEEVVQKNYDAVDHTLAKLHQVDVPQTVSSKITLSPPVSDQAPAFVRDVIGEMIAGRGDALPVSVLPVDGTYPAATSRWETRDVTQEVPIWEPDICAQCGNCEIVCPHAVIRMKVYDDQLLVNAPDQFKSVPLKGRDAAAHERYTLQVAVENCTGCTLCVSACPVEKEDGRKPIMMGQKAPILEHEKANWSFFNKLPEYQQTSQPFNRMRESQLMTPTFEFSGACAGCGETPYLKLITQLFGEHTVLANATGCSSIFGGNLPTTPWAKNSQGRGVAWSNSLFEDNAEFGFGFRITIDKLSEYAAMLLNELRGQLEPALVNAILDADQSTGADVDMQRERLIELRTQLQEINTDKARDLAALTDYLLKRTVWIVGGDGWAYDIGFGGLDHVIASDKNVNILVMDTEVYSNTGGQQSKATPRAATAQFASSGKTTAKKDLGMIAMTYGHAYVAQVAFGADPKQTVRAMQEAVAHEGPSIIIAYATCIAQGIDLTNTVTQMQAAVSSAYWPLYRFNPALRERGRNPMQLDSESASISFAEYATKENRYRQLQKINPEHADDLMQQAQNDVDEKWRTFSEMAKTV